ncbi:MAG TPA: hypothetical protein VG961_07270 [Ignavibacteria bacterium]|nr:hypothetical protein [Ignavibacteria bacterium]
MSEDTTPGTDAKVNKSRDTLWILGAFGLMIIAIFTIWQFLLKGKTEEERSLLKDTVVQVKTDTIKITDSLNSSKIHSTQTYNSNTGITEQPKDTSNIKSKLSNLSDEDKAKLKDKFEELPKNKQGRIKKKLRTSLNK